MLLTNKEEAQLKKEKSKVEVTRYNTKNSQFCALGHKLNYVYWRSHIEKRLGKIHGLFYCPRCEKLYRSTMVEVKDNESL